MIYTTEGFPRFIWGEGVDLATDSTIDERLFLTHTAAPQFVCEIYDTDELPEIDSIPDHLGMRELVGEFAQRNGERIWQSNAEFFAARWIFLGDTPNDDELHQVMLDAALDFQLWLDANGLLDDLGE